MKITMLGTGNALVTRCYNTCFVMDNGTDKLLVDAGGGNGGWRQWCADAVGAGRHQWR